MVQVADIRTVYWPPVLFIGDLFNGTAQYDEDKVHALQLIP